MAELDDITRGYQALSTNFVDEAGAIAGNTFRNLGSWRDEDIATFIEQVSVPLEGIKRNAASSAIAYHEQVARVTKNAFKAPSVAGLDLSMGALRNGANVNQVYGRPFVQMRMALVKGASFTDALDTGALTATSFARTEVQLSRRQASLFARKANDNIVGYLRTLTGRENCALCYVASTQRYNKGDLLPIHPACDCGEMPIYGDSDPGQIIDQQLLDKSHEAVGQRFGIDAGGREPDYRKIMIRDHGEMGPMLTVRGQKFTGPHSLDLVGKKMPKPKALPPAGERVAKIREKADRIDGTQVQADIRAEFLDIKNPHVETNRKSVTFIQAGPKAQKYLDDVLEVGKDVDDELSRRLKQRIDSLPDSVKNIDLKSLRDEISLTVQQRREVVAQISGIESKVDNGVRVALLQRGATAQQIQTLRYSGSFDKYVERAFQRDKELFDELKKLKRREDKLAFQVDFLNNQVDKAITPGSKAFDAIMADEAAKLIEEIRGSSSKVPKLSGTGATNAGIQATFPRMLSKYPEKWVDTFVEKFPEVKVTQARRGRWTNNGGTPQMLVESKNPRVKGFGSLDSVTVHEIGHGMEDVIPGLKQMEYAYWQRRAKGDGNKIKGIYKPRSTIEFGNFDEWREPYSGKSYGLGANSNYEIFTTGVESLLSGSGYFGDATKGLTVDDDFRQFILGVLIGL